MRRNGTEKKLCWIRGIIRKLPVFYRILIIMLCMVLLMVLGININGSIFQESLTENYLELTHSKLQHNSDTMCNAVFNIYAIPQAIEDTSYFNYIRLEKSGTLPNKYISVLPLFRQALTNQFYLRGENLECLLYFSGPNCMVTLNRCFQYAEDCFDSYIVIDTEEKERLINAMNTSNSQQLIPLQNVTIGNTHHGTCWAYVVRPYGNSVTVTAIYPMDYIVNSLDLSSLPPETVLTVDSLMGERLVTYPADAQDYETEEYHRLTVKGNRLNCKFSVYIPNSYFDGQMQHVLHNSLLITVLVALIGIIFAFLMSRISSRPIRNLVKTHGQDMGDLKNSEEEILDQILHQNRQVQTELHENLASNLLARLFAGAILSEKETQQLSEYIAALQWPCQVAILHAGSEANLMQICNYIRLVLGEDVFCQPVSIRQIGVLLSGNYDQLVALENAVDTLQKQYPQIHIRCGVSGSVERLEQMHTAVHQARLAMPKDQGFDVYVLGGSAARASLSWLQHERLYQSIVNDDEESAMNLLQLIAMEPYRGTAAREAYYNILFVLRSAAAALNIAMEEIEMLVYDQSQLPWENIQGLNAYVKLLFGRIRQQKEQKQDDTKHRIIDFIGQNFADCNLCAATVAHEFMLSEKRIYSIVREVTDMSFNEYLLTVRMRQAGQLLCASSDSTVEIAIKCGYQAESTFYRVFKRYFGITPGEYRQKGGC